jgi:hypothetical protein
MDYTAIRWVRKAPCRETSDKLILMILASYGNRDGDTVDAWPSMETLIEDSGLSERTVYRAIERLCEDGLIERFPPAGSRKSNTYRLNVPPQEKKQAPRNANPRRIPSAGPSQESSCQPSRLTHPPLPGPDAIGVRGWNPGDTVPKRSASA